METKPNLDLKKGKPGSVTCPWTLTVQGWHHHQWWLRAQGLNSKMPFLCNKDLFNLWHFSHTVIRKYSTVQYCRCTGRMLCRMLQRAEQNQEIWFLISYSGQSFTSLLPVVRLIQMLPSAPLWVYSLFNELHKQPPHKWGFEESTCFISGTQLIEANEAVWGGDLCCLWSCKDHNLLSNVNIHTYSVPISSYSYKPINWVDVPVLQTLSLLVNLEMQLQWKWIS